VWEQLRLKAIRRNRNDGKHGGAGRIDHRFDCGDDFSAQAASDCGYNGRIDNDHRDDGNYREDNYNDGRDDGPSTNDESPDDDTAAHHGTTDDEGSDNYNDRSASNNYDASVVFRHGIPVKPPAEQRRDGLRHIKRSEYRVHGHGALRLHEHDPKWHNRRVRERVCRLSHQSCHSWLYGGCGREHRQWPSDVPDHLYAAIGLRGAQSANRRAM
jgi:hypothetical protein